VAFFVIIDGSDLEDEGPYLAVTLDCSFHNVCSSVFGVYSMCNMGMHHAMVVTQMWKYNNKFYTYLVVSARINEHCCRQKT